MPKTEPARPASDQLSKYGAASAHMGEHLQQVNIVGLYLRDLLVQHDYVESAIEANCFSLGRACLGRDPWDAFDLLWARIEKDIRYVEAKKDFGHIAIVQDVPKPTKMLTDYLSQVKQCCGEKGIFPQPLLCEASTGQMTMMMVADNGHACAKQAKEALRKGAKEMVFGMDRSAVPDQGLEFNDFVTLIWYVDKKFYTAVIDYVPAEDEDDQIIREPNWDNNWWNNHLAFQLLPDLREAAGTA
jgi:hypothetical protein